MSVINRVPRALLPLLDAKTLGRTPVDIEEKVSTGIDLTEAYLSDIPMTMEFVSTPTITQFNEGNPLEVPAGELWAVYWASVHFRPTTGFFSYGVLGFNPANFTGFICLAVSTPNDLSSSLPAGLNQAYANWMPPRPFYMSAGDQFTGRVESASGNNNVNIRACIRKLAV